MAVFVAHNTEFVLAVSEAYKKLDPIGPTQIIKAGRYEFTLVPLTETERSAANNPRMSVDLTTHRIANARLVDDVH